MTIKDLEKIEMHLNKDMVTISLWTEEQLPENYLDWDGTNATELCALSNVVTSAAETYMTALRFLITYAARHQDIGK